MPWYLYYPNTLFSVFLAMLQKSPEAGAYCSVFCAVVNNAVEMDAGNNEGCYFVNSEPQPLEKLALNKEDAERLWGISRKLVGHREG